MEVFLSRCEQVTNLFDLYRQELEDTRLINQVLFKLSRPWQLAAGLDRTRLEDLSWEEVFRALQLEDNARRQADTRAHDAMFPLGWQKGVGFARVTRAAYDAKAEVDSDSDSGKSCDHQGYAARVKGSTWKQKGHKPYVTAVCYRCQQQGHMWTHCPKRTEGDNWVPKQTDRDAAQAARKKLQSRPGAPVVSKTDEPLSPQEGRVTHTSV
jgi:hypothetical protein